MQHILGLVRRCVEDYNMIETGETVAVGVSGGKDSLLTLAALARLREFYPKPFEVQAITLETGMPGMDFAPIADYCAALDVPYIRIGVPVYEAKEYIETYFERFPGIRRYMDEVVAQAKERGYVETLMHRRRALPELAASNFNTRSFGERVARNMPIQGTAADVIKLAMVRVDERLHKENLKAKLILQVHDELIVECPEEEKETVARLLTEEMEGAVHLSVPLTVEAHWGINWLEAK